MTWRHVLATSIAWSWLGRSSRTRESADHLGLLRGGCYSSRYVMCHVSQHFCTDFEIYNIIVFYLYTCFICFCRHKCWLRMPTTAALTGPWRPTCCGCLGASYSTTATGTAWTGSSCPTHGRLQMLRMRTSLRGVGLRQCLLPRTVASVTPAPRRPRVLSSPDAPCCYSYGHTRGSQSVGPSSITRRTGLIFTATSTTIGPRWGLSGAAVRYVCERNLRSLILIIIFCTSL